MDSGEHYVVKDMKLADQGKKNIAWAEAEMGALMEVKAKFEREKPLQGARVAVCLHITKETAVLVRTLIAGGADVAVCSCNPLSTQDDVAAALASEGVHVYGYKDENKEDYYAFIKKVIEFNPNITIDDGCDLVSEIHEKYPHLIPTIWGGCEETTTGIIRLNSMAKDNALKYPVVAVNDNKTKHLLDNYYGTAQSTLDGVIRATNILLAGKTVVVAGYGSCGKGVAKSARGQGANVIVTEVANFPALQAKMDGFRVMKMDEASKLGDVFVTVTGCRDVITQNHMKNMKNNAIVCNSGHFDIEIDYSYLSKFPKEEIRPLMEAFTLENGNRIICLGKAKLVNLACAEGHPSAVMSTSFCGQALAVEYIVKNKDSLKKEVITLPEEIDETIAGLQLKALNVKIDSLTPEQEKYLNSWNIGT